MPDFRIKMLRICQNPRCEKEFNGIIRQLYCCPSCRQTAHYLSNSDECKTRATKWNREHRDHVNQRNRKSHLKCTYNLTIEGYNELMKIQNYCCKLCKLPFKDKEIPSVDHDHNCCPGVKSCGKCVRGLLHFKCNSAIGLMNDSVELCSKALDYLECGHEKRINIL